MKSQPYPSLYLLQARRSLACVLLLLVSLIGFAQNDWKKTMRQTDPAFFQTAEARRIGDQLLVYQRVTGEMQLFRHPEKSMSDFDAVVSSGESIQEAVNKAPVAADHTKSSSVRANIGRWCS